MDSVTVFALLCFILVKFWRHLVGIIFGLVGIFMFGPFVGFCIGASVYMSLKAIDGSEEEHPSENQRKDHT